MDDFIVLVFWFFAAPFWLAWKIIKLVWEYIAKPLNQKLADDLAEKRAEELNRQCQDKEAERQKVRSEQIAALRAAAPQSPPERMRATIHVNEVKIPRLQRKQVKHLVAEHSWITVEVGEDARWAVDMLLEMSETERGVVRQYQLEDVTIEDAPTFDKDALRKARVQESEEVSATKDMLLKEVKRQVLSWPTTCERKPAPESSSATTSFFLSPNCSRVRMRPRSTPTDSRPKSYPHSASLSTAIRRSHHSRRLNSDGRISPMVTPRWGEGA